MDYKVQILGRNGRMGKELCSLLETPFIFEDTSLSLAKNENCDLWIDFSSPQGTLDLLGRISTPMVIGTTGFNDEQKHSIEKYSQTNGVVFSPNFSVGINLLFSILEKIPPYFANFFEGFIVEEHHKNKKDSPSGTALKLKEILLEGKFSDIPISSIRTTDTLGIHQVSLVSEMERLEFSHLTKKRTTFAKGALLASCFLLRRQVKGLYTMKDVIKGFYD